MTDDINYKNNPLHGLSLKPLLTELVDQYGFEILFAYLNINCFKTNPSIESSVKFLKKTDWAREKVEAFYMYQFKSLPKASGAQFALPPRDRIVPSDQMPGEPAVLSLEDAERLREKREKKAAEFGGKGKVAGSRSGGYRRDGASRGNSRPRTEGTEQGKPNKPQESSPAASDTSSGVDPWAKWK
ncbi:VF530 family DNA-binding protein [Thalassolituus sp.]|jgi:uncharacterized protein (DUF2132 family)|uniref:VF530 family protein n=1 Tax=Thalassolituus sp. TaxID=2030822 RepID=UPI002A8280E1|nr:VF530 family DNA-binding protein [Thalassolituus sp.]